MKARVTVSAAVIMFLAASNTQAIASPAAGSAGGGGIAIGGHAGNTGGFGCTSFGRSSFNARTIGGGAGISTNSSYRGKSWGGGLGHGDGFGHGGGFRHGHWGGGWNNSYRNYGGSYRQFGNIGAGVYYPGVYPGGVIQYNQPVIQPPAAAQERDEEDRERDSDIRRKDDERRQKLPTSAFVKNYDFNKKKGTK